MIVCLFDIDGTLLSSGGAGKAAMEAALGTAFEVPCAFGDIPFSGRTDRAIGRDLFRLNGIADSAQNWRRFLDAYLQLLPSYLARHNGKILPGIASFLECLPAPAALPLALLPAHIRHVPRPKL